jgi:hypothetical protein
VAQAQALAHRAHAQALVEKARELYKIFSLDRWKAACELAEWAGFERMVLALASRSTLRELQKARAEGLPVPPPLRVTLVELAVQLAVGRSKGGTESGGESAVLAGALAVFLELDKEGALRALLFSPKALRDRLLTAFLLGCDEAELRELRRLVIALIAKSKE